MRYRYVAYDAAGKRHRGEIEAASAEEARSLLRQRGLFVERIAAKRGLDLGWLRREIPAQELIDFSLSLALYLRSGIPLAQALHLLRSRYGGKMGEFLFRVQKEIDEGRSFYEALGRQKVYKIPRFYLESIKVAQESGELEEVLRQSALFLKEQRRLGEALRRALVYPAFIVVVSLLLMGFMLTYVVPKITAIFEQLDQELPFVTQVVIGVGEFVQQHWLTILLGAVALYGLWRFAAGRSRALRMARDGIVLRLPIIGEIALYSDLGRYTHLLATLSRSGVTFVHAAKLAFESVKNERLRRTLERATDELIEGKSFFAALQRSGFDYDRSFLHSIALAEESGEVTEVLQNLAELYAERTRSKVELFISLLEPLLILVVGLMVGIVVVAMLLPIFRMNILSF